MGELSGKGKGNGGGWFLSGWGGVFRGERGEGKINVYVRTEQRKQNKGETDRRESGNTKGGQGELD